MKAFCLFEQSGTFKNEFIKLGIPAEDYDILNQFGETDNVIDLFKAIEEGYNGEPSIFDNIKKDDIVLAFFPCTRFEAQNYLNAKGNNSVFKDWALEKKIEYSRKNVSEIEHNYQIFSQLVLIALKRGFKLICENPATTKHVLKDFFPVNPAWIDMDRRDRGDNFKKPTQYWFINCEPKHNFIWEPQPYIANTKTIVECNTVERSMITSEYANRFIREFILEDKGGVE